MKKFWKILVGLLITLLMPFILLVLVIWYGLDLPVWVYIALGILNVIFCGVMGGVVGRSIG